MFYWFFFLNQVFHLRNIFKNLTFFHVIKKSFIVFYGETLKDNCPKNTSRENSSKNTSIKNIVKHTLKVRLTVIMRNIYNIFNT